MAKITDVQRALLAEADAHPEGLIEAVTDRHRQPVEEGRAKAEQLRRLADDGRLELHRITGDKNNPVGERVIVFKITAKGRRALM